MALANDPLVLVADEPTDRLDDNDAATLLTILRVQADHGIAVVVATRSAQVAGTCDRVLRLEDGALLRSAADR